MQVMISSVKIKLISLAGVIHLKIFGHEMGDEMEKFLGNLGWMGSGALVSGIFIFITNLAAGRL